MSEIKFFVYSLWKNIVTGGQKYDSELFHIIEKCKGVQAECVEIGCHDSTPSLLKPLKEFRNGVKNDKADLIIFNSSKCLRFLALMAWLRIIARRKVYSIHHHFIYLEFKGIKRLVYRLAESMFLRLSTKIIIPSPYIYSELLKRRKPQDLLFWRIPFETKAAIPSESVKGRLVFAGTIEPRKGIIYLLKALKELKDEGVTTQLFIMGKVIDEAYDRMLRQFVEENNLDVIFTGFLSLEEKNKLLASADVFVFPSLLEGFGMVLVEAQVYGLPIVCFNNSSMPFSVKDGENGFTVPTGDFKDMAQKIKLIISDRNLREKLSLGALENVKNQNTYQNFAKTVENYFNNRTQF